MVTTGIVMLLSLSLDEPLQSCPRLVRSVIWALYWVLEALTVGSTVCVSLAEHLKGAEQAVWAQSHLRFEPVCSLSSLGSESPERHHLCWVCPFFFLEPALANMVVLSIGNSIV